MQPRGRTRDPAGHEGLRQTVRVTQARTALDRLPLPGWMALWLVLWALYLSIVDVGQVWYGFGWESLLVEAGFLAVFLGPAHVAPPVLVLWLLRWV